MTISDLKPGESFADHTLNEYMVVTANGNNLKIKPVLDVWEDYIPAVQKRTGILEIFHPDEKILKRM